MMITSEMNFLVVLSLALPSAIALRGSHMLPHPTEEGIGEAAAAESYGSVLVEDEDILAPRRLEEEVACVDFDSVSVETANHELSDVFCQENNCSDGCCRIYNWLLCDRNNAFPDIPCVCNKSTQNQLDFEPTSAPTVAQTSVSDPTSAPSISYAQTDASNSINNAVDLTDATNNVTTLPDFMHTTNSSESANTNATEEDGEDDWELYMTVLPEITHINDLSENDNTTAMEEEEEDDDWEWELMEDETIGVDVEDDGMNTSPPTFSPVSKSPATPEPTNSGTVAPTFHPATPSPTIRLTTPSLTDTTPIPTTTKATPAPTPALVQQSVVESGFEAPSTACSEGSLYHDNENFAGFRQCATASECQDNECCLVDFCFCGRVEDGDVSRCVP